MEKINYIFYISKPSHYVTILKIAKDKNIDISESVIFIFGNFDGSNEFFDQLKEKKVWGEMYFSLSRLRSSLSLYLFCKSEGRKGKVYSLFYDNDFGKESIYLKFIRNLVNEINLFDDGNFTYIRKIPNVGGKLNRAVRFFYRLAHLPMSYGSSKYVDSYYVLDEARFLKERKELSIKYNVIETPNLIIKNELECAFSIPKLNDDVLILFCLPKFIDLDLIAKNINRLDAKNNVVLKVHPGGRVSFEYIKDYLESACPDIRFINFDSLIPIEAYLDIVDINDVFLYHFGSTIGVYQNINKNLLIQDLV